MEPATRPTLTRYSASFDQPLDGSNRPPVIEPDGEGELLEVSMGPQHPSTHGVFRMDVVLDGERVVRLKPVFGYLHRNHEKIARDRQLPRPRCPTPTGSTTSARSPTTGPTRWRSRSSPARQFPSAPSTSASSPAELTRLQNHASAIGFLIQDMGASGTPLMYAFREREKILDLFEASPARA